MANQSARTTELEDAVRDIYDTVQDVGSTRADMETALDAISDLCTDAIPDLDETDEASSEADDDETDND